MFILRSKVFKVDSFCILNILNYLKQLMCHKPMRFCFAIVPLRKSIMALWFFLLLKFGASTQIVVETSNPICFDWGLFHSLCFVHWCNTKYLFCPYETQMIKNIYFHEMNRYKQRYTYIDFIIRIFGICLRLCTT